MFHVQLAGSPFTIENRFPYIENLCRDYRTEIPGEWVSVSREEIAWEQPEDGRWPAGYLESLAIYRKICECLISQDILLFHCSALAYRGKAYLFAASSGTGKSTHTRLWREAFGEDVVMINDDKPLLRVTRQGVTVFGTPFAGKEGLQTNTSAAVGGIVLLHQAKENTIRPLTMEESYPRLLTQTYRPKDPVRLIKTMELVHTMAKLPVFSLGCTISREAAELARETLTTERSIER